MAEEKFFIPTVKVEFKDKNFVPQRTMFDCATDADDWFLEQKDNYVKMSAPTVDEFTHFENDQVIITREDFNVPVSLITMIKCIIEGKNVIG